MPNQFNLIMTGKSLAGHSREAAAAALAKVMRVPEDRALAMLSGQEQVVKRNLDEASLARYVAALRGAGVETRTEAVAPVAADPVAAPMPAKRPVKPLSGEDIDAMSEKDLDALIRKLEAPMAVGDGVVECPCCRMIALKNRSVGEECPICGWRDFQGQNEFYPDEVVSGRNRSLSLRQAREEFEAYGSLDPKDYKPNAVPLRKRITETLVMLFVVAYCGYSLWSGSLFLPGFNRYAPGTAKSVTLHGIDAWLVSGALLFGVLQFFVPILDHYDKRRNEVRYRKIAFACRVLMFVSLGLFFLIFVFRESKGGLEFTIMFGALLLAVIATVIFVKKNN